MATIIRTHSKEDEGLVELFCQCLYYTGRSTERTPYSKKVLKKALELFIKNNLASVVERDEKSSIHWLLLATPESLFDTPFKKNLNVAITGLERGGVSSIQEILGLSDAELRSDRFPGIGKAILRALDERLSEIGLQRGVPIMGLEDEPWPEEEK